MKKRNVIIHGFVLTMLISPLVSCAMTRSDAVMNSPPATAKSSPNPKSVVVVKPSQNQRSAQPSSSDQAGQEKSANNKAEVLEQNASAAGDKSTPTSAERITKTEVQAVDPKGQEPMDESITCLARSIYWEAKGEDATSMQAIANVVMNRLGHEGFPSTICGVVKQGQEHGACQFSWWCDGQPDTVQEQKHYTSAKEIARKALNKQLEDITHGAMYFHQHKSTPSWAKEYILTATVGEHLFYKPSGGKAK